MSRISPLIKQPHNLGFKIDLVEMITPISNHVHKIQTRFFSVLEGSLTISTPTQKILLTTGAFITIPPEIVHSIQPHSAARFVAIDIPGCDAPHGVFFEENKFPIHPPFVANSNKSSINNFIRLKQEPSFEKLPQNYVDQKITQSGYEVYPLAQDDHNLWDIAILDIYDSPEHFHKKSMEHFLVLNGTLKLTIDDYSYYLCAGQSTHIASNTIHQLASNDPLQAVRVLCISFPAFDAKDFHISSHNEPRKNTM